MLIKRFYEVDPLSCPECGGQMVVVALIESLQSEAVRENLARAPERSDGRRPVLIIGSQIATGQYCRARYGPCPSLGSEPKKLT